MDFMISFEAVSAAFIFAMAVGINAPGGFISTLIFKMIPAVISAGLIIDVLFRVGYLQVPGAS